MLKKKKNHWTKYIQYFVIEKSYIKVCLQNKICEKSVFMNFNIVKATTSWNGSLWTGSKSTEIFAKNEPLSTLRIK